MPVSHAALGRFTGARRSCDATADQRTVRSQGINSLCRDPPEVASRITKPTSQIIACGFLHGWLDRLSARSKGSIIDRLGVGNVNMNMNFCRQIRRRATSDHHDAVVDTNLGMHQRAVRPIEATKQRRVEYSHHEIDDPFGLMTYEIRTDRGVSRRFPVAHTRSIPRVQEKPLPVRAKSMGWAYGGAVFDLDSRILSDLSSASWLLPSAMTI